MTHADVMCFNLAISSNNSLEEAVNLQCSCKSSHHYFLCLFSKANGLEDACLIL